MQTIPVVKRSEAVEGSGYKVDSHLCNGLFKDQYGSIVFGKEDNQIPILITLLGIWRIMNGLYQKISKNNVEKISM